jgi:hypothetical protein
MGCMPVYAGYATSLTIEHNEIPIYPNMTSILHVCLSSTGITGNADFFPST